DEILAVAVDDAFELADHADLLSRVAGSNSWPKHWIPALKPERAAVVTKPKDLRPGRSVWQGRRARPVPHRPLRRDIENDVLGIRGGVTRAIIPAASPAGG